MLFSRAPGTKHDMFHLAASRPFLAFALPRRLGAGFPADEHREYRSGIAEGVYGPWQIRDEAGIRTCQVEPGQTIGGSEIDIDPACPGLLAVMGGITAWRLMRAGTSTSSTPSARCGFPSLRPTTPMSRSPNRRHLHVDQKWRAGRRLGLRRPSDRRGRGQPSRRRQWRRHPG